MFEKEESPYLIFEDHDIPDQDKGPYTYLDKRILDDPDISCEVIGVYVQICYLQQNENIFVTEELIKEISHRFHHKEEHVRSLVAELQKFNIAKR